MLDVEFYRLYNSTMVFGPVIWYRVFAAILPCFLRFSQKFAVFFKPFLPWFSTVPTTNVHCYVLRAAWLRSMLHVCVTRCWYQMLSNVYRRCCNLNNLHRLVQEEKISVTFSIILQHTVQVARLDFNRINITIIITVMIIDRFNMT